MGTGCGCCCICCSSCSGVGREDEPGDPAGASDSEDGIATACTVGGAVWGTPVINGAPGSGADNGGAPSVAPGGNCAIASCHWMMRMVNSCK